jgi:transcriptional regulator with XRE-family HTH domain
VGDFIRAQRELMSLSMRQLAEMAQVSNPYLSQIERGVYKPSAQVLKGIADALDMSAETLYREAGLLDDSVERPALSVEEAIRVDLRLTHEGKQALIQVYQGLVAAQPAPEPSSRAPMASRAAEATASVARRAVTRTVRKAATGAAKPVRKAPAAATARKSKSATTAVKSTSARARKSATARTTKTTATVKPARKAPAKSTRRSR